MTGSPTAPAEIAIGDLAAFLLDELDAGRFVGMRVRRELVSGAGQRPSRRRRTDDASHEPAVLLAVGLVLLVLSGIAPYERGTWWMEIFPIVLAVPVLVLSARRFPLTPLAYRLIFLHACILMLGGHYTYARVPLGFWVQDALDLARNHYDRLGHFAQGFVPAIIARELLLRRSPLRPGKWLFFIVAAICLAISACYEFIEWWAALAGGAAATDFLGTQGDPWDTQWDMFIALVGAIVAQLLLARRHDEQIERLREARFVTRYRGALCVLRNSELLAADFRGRRADRSSRAGPGAPVLARRFKFFLGTHETDRADASDRSARWLRRHAPGLNPN